MLGLTEERLDLLSSSLLTSMPVLISDRCVYLKPHFLRFQTTCFFELVYFSRTYRERITKVTTWDLIIFNELCPMVSVDIPNDF